MNLQQAARRTVALAFVAAAILGIADRAGAEGSIVGGLDENRIVEVAGFADRKLKVESDPYAASNRRIEILLEAGE